MPASDQIERQLKRWTEAGLLDAASAERIRNFESARDEPGTRWPVIFAVAFGAIMVAAGVLLFVAAHWDDLSPAQRFVLVLAMTAGFHLAAGALMPRMRALGLALHAVGTITLGGGIFLAGQIFNLEEHWPGGIMLWALGAVLSWTILRDWLQATLSVLLVPAWIASEWSVQAENHAGTERILFQFLTLLAITYLSARRGDDDSPFRRALMWAGGIAVLPLSVALGLSRVDYRWEQTLPKLSISTHVLGLLMAFGLPLLAAFFLRRKAAIWNVGYALWVYLVTLLDDRKLAQSLVLYLLCAAAAVGFVLWGLHEQRRERINLGVAGFAITIAIFYFDNVMGKLGRSAALIGFGLLFLLGGWQLERLRRKLVARTREAQP